MDDATGKSGSGLTAPFGQPNFDRAIGWYFDGGLQDVYCIFHGKAYRIKAGTMFDPEYIIIPCKESEASEKMHRAYADLPWWFQQDQDKWKAKLHKAITGLPPR